MTWWMWVVLWLVLGLAALAVLGFLGWRAVKSGLALMDEVDKTGDTLSEISGTIDDLGDVRHRESAIFADPGLLRAERDHRARVRIRSKREHPSAPDSMNGPPSSRTMRTDV